MRITRSLFVALAAALVGLFTSGYLLVEYVGAGDTICLTGGGCETVRDSAFAYPLGIPLPLFGVGFYLAAAAVILLPERHAGRLPIGHGAALLVVGSAGLVASAILTAIEIFVVGALCSWCLVSAGAAAMLFLAALAVWRQPGVERPIPGRSQRVRRQAAEAAAASRRGLHRFGFALSAALTVGFAGLLTVTALSTPGPVAGGPDRVERATIGSGPVEVVVFSDFECPACAAAAPVLHDLVDDGQVTLIYRYFPLTQIHDKALAAAHAAEAASRQGRFWEMHDELFASQQAWAGLAPSQAVTYFEQLADGLGLEMDRYVADRDSQAVAATVAADLAEARRLALPGTPSIFIGGSRYDGPLSIEGLRSAVPAVP